MPRVIFTIALLAAAACRTAPAPAVKETAKENVPPPPIAQFLEALRNQDQAAFLGFFSETQPWEYMGTLLEPNPRQKVTFQELKADFAAKKGFYETLLDGDGDDCFRDWATGVETSAWQQTSPGHFVRQTIDGKETVYITFRRDSSRWVVSVLAEPGG